MPDIGNGLTSRVGPEFSPISQVHSLPLEKVPDAVPEQKTQLNIFNLRDLKAPELAVALKELFAPDKVRIAAHASTNTVIVIATLEQLETIRSLVAKLEATAAEVNKDKLNKAMDP